MTHEEEQDLNRQVAEAEGWYFDQELKLWRHKSDDPWRCPECLWDMRNRPEGDCELGHCSMRPRPIRTPPDYLHDKAWLWDTMEKEHLVHQWFSSGRVVVRESLWGVAEYSNYCESPAEAVCRWRVAAAKAGVKGEG
jgi:hypothetical protein